jgi:hypothetical protein
MRDTEAHALLRGMKLQNVLDERQTRGFIARVRKNQCLRQSVVMNSFSAAHICNEAGKERCAAEK